MLSRPQQPICPASRQALVNPTGLHQVFTAITDSGVLLKIALLSLHICGIMVNGDGSKSVIVNNNYKTVCRPMTARTDDRTHRCIA